MRKVPRPDGIPSRCLLWTLSLFLSATTAHGADAPELRYRLDGRASGERLGPDVVVLENFDGDGGPDLAVAGEEYGEVLIFSELRERTGTGSSADPTYRILLPDIGRIRLFAHDVNEDGLTDLLVGLPTLNGGGALQIFYGASDYAAQLTSSDAAVWLTGPEGSELGTSAVLALRGAGGPSLLVGAPGESSHSGAIYRLELSLIAGLDPIETPVGDASLIRYSLASVAGARLGAAMSSEGDLDADGDLDLVLGAPGLPDGLDGGRVLLWPAYIELESPDLSGLPTLVGSQPGEQTGVALLSREDVSGDATPDLLIGVATADAGGRLLLVLGGADLADRLPQSSPDAQLTDAIAGSLLGSRLCTATDLSGDGVPDLAVGAPGGPALPGRVLLAHLEPNLATGGVSLRVGTMLEDASGTAFGSALAADGSLLLVGAPGGGDPGAESGRVSIFDLSSIADDSDGDGVTSYAGDCDDASDTRYPGAEERCNGVDDDCDGLLPIEEQDQDGDTVPLCESDAHPLGDCDDLNPSVYPGAAEQCNGLDEDCDGALPAAEQDLDGDDHTPCGLGGLSDCDDSSPQAWTDAEEVCDGFDNNCDGILLENELDQDGDGYLQCATASLPADCDDTRDTNSPGGQEICDGLDNNCDGAPDLNELDLDDDGFTECGVGGSPSDCSPTDPRRFPGAEELCDGIDNDCDGQVPPQEQDEDEDGVRACAEDSIEADCNDQDSHTYPGAQEHCDGQDNDCDGNSDPDQDGDGHWSCAAPLPDESNDCDDTQATSYPGAEEICDGLDNDCDGSLSGPEQDHDEDGFAGCGLNSLPPDCDDADLTSYPGATEQCDLKDNDCDTVTDEDVQLSFYLDTDGDGWGVETTSQSACTPPEGYASQSGDCDDGSATRYPGALEVCDALDNDCDGIVPDIEADRDDDSWPACAGDCNDLAPLTYPGAVEQCDQQDNDCDELVPSDETVDSDRDGFTECQGDCNDRDRSVHPGAEEVYDSRDNDCNLITDDVSCEGKDGDSDGHVGLPCEGAGTLDCNDENPLTYPGASEICDSQDNDCDGTLDEGVSITFYFDGDGDGYGDSEIVVQACNRPSDRFITVGGDCDDTNAAVHPGSAELCNDADDNCDGETDEGVTGTWYPDEDGDGHGEPSLAREGCAVEGDVALGDDCNDSSSLAAPGLEEVADDGLDNDCDGTIDEMPFSGVGWSCSALQDSSGVGLACNLAPSSTPRAPALPGPWFLLALGLGRLLQRRFRSPR